MIHLLQPSDSHKLLTKKGKCKRDRNWNWNVLTRKATSCLYCRWKYIYIYLSNARRHLIPTAVSSLCFALSGLCIIQKRIMNAFKIPVYIVNWIWIQSELKNNAFIQIWIQGSRIKMVEFKGSAVNNISFQYEITHKHVYCHATNGVFPEF